MLRHPLNNRQPYTQKTCNLIFALIAGFAVLSLFATPTVTLAAESETGDLKNAYLRVLTGSSTLNLDGGSIEDNKQLIVRFELGYHLTDQFRLELGRSQSMDFLSELFGTEFYDFSETTFALAYAFQAGQGQIVPKLGYSNYNVRVKDGGLFSPTITTESFNNQDAFFSLEAYYKISPSGGLLAEWTTMDTEFGQWHSINIGAHFEF